MKLTLVMAVAMLLLGASAAAATAASPAKYRTRMNAICRVYGPKLVASQDTMAHASAANRKTKFEAALRRYLSFDLRQNHQLEAVRVPASLQTTMKPIIKSMKKVDPHLFSALVHTRKGDIKAARSQLKTVARLSMTLPGQLDAAGLISCGSLQQ